MPVPRNAAERAFYESMSQRVGWQLTKRGWPDYFCWHVDSGRIVLVEVIAHRGRRLKRKQRLVMLALAQRYKVPCYQWSPDGGFCRVGLKTL